MENFRRGSADGLSLQFIIVWLAGDVFNILGAVLQGVLPTMIILAIYYTLADIVLLGQCFYYRGFTWHDEIIPPKGTDQIGEATDRSGLLARERRPSTWSEVSASHLSPAVPLLHAPGDAEPLAIADQKPTTALQATAFNLFAILMVCAAGVFGWWISSGSQGSPQRRHHSSSDAEFPEFNLLGQIFGYFCAVLYLGSRVPQLLLNYRRKSTEGVSMLFFLFACIGNLTYVLSIFAYEVHCSGKRGECGKGEAASLYARYIAVNASWLAGSLGTLVLDMGIFTQFFLDREREDYETEDSAVESGSQSPDSSREQRPLHDRGTVGY